jgi:hypothetical protein
MPRPPSGTRHAPPGEDPTDGNLGRCAQDCPEPAGDRRAPGLRGAPAWRVKGTGFVWIRPLGKKDLLDLEDLGGEPPDGPILGARVADVGVKEALISDDPDVFFTLEGGLGGGRRPGPPADLGA